MIPSTCVQGAAAFISDANTLTAAAGILAVEAYHAGSVRKQLIQNSSYVVMPYGVEVNVIIGVRTGIDSNMNHTPQLYTVTVDEDLFELTVFIEFRCPSLCLNVN